MSIKITCDAFEDGGQIPVRYTKEGDNVSPPLKWENLPRGTKEVALICEDPDAPRDEPFVHWVAYHIPPDCDGLPEGLPHKQISAVNHTREIAQGENSFRDIGYDGPLPPPGHGVHHYHFRVYALDRPLQIRSFIDNKHLLDSMEGHILDSGEIIGTYER